MRRKQSQTFVMDSDSESDEEEGDSNADATDNSSAVIRRRRGADDEEAERRRTLLKAMTKESRHNVISRKDNLILNPENAPIIEEETVRMLTICTHTRY